MLAFSFDEQGDCTQSVQIQMRSKAVVSGIPITTTIAALTSTVEGLMDKHDFGRFEVCSLQEYHRHVKK